MVIELNFENINFQRRRNQCFPYIDLVNIFTLNSTLTEPWKWRLSPFSNLLLRNLLVGQQTREIALNPAINSFKCFTYKNLTFQLHSFKHLIPVGFEKITFLRMRISTFYLSSLIRSSYRDAVFYVIFVHHNIPLRQDYPEPPFQMASTVHVIRKPHYYCHTELRQLQLMEHYGWTV